MIDHHKVPLQSEHTKAQVNDLGQQGHDSLCVGIVTAVHGVRGEVKLRSLMENSQDIEGFSMLYLDDACVEEVVVKTLRGQKDDVFIAAFKTVDTRDEAEKLRGKKLYIPRDALPAIDESDTFYRNDLEGLLVKDTQGHDLGYIESVMNFGAGDLIEVVLLKGQQKVLIPFAVQWVHDVNLHQGYVVVDAAYLDEMARPESQDKEKGL